ncbi:hypothetical protein L0665_09640 [Methanogenium marinum]|uniref:Uncharacterized protein n=1 Tax=Methanogenium marinum TaxID=348610 RepID=A0A9Q4KU50_9EURY|nr:hypothetical protein [Methanogenium marinum]MDE4908867.1 hypothetical protein [Methanogenium marinum]
MLYCPDERFLYDTALETIRDYVMRSGTTSHNMQHHQYYPYMQSITSVQSHKYLCHRQENMTATKRIPVSEPVWTSLSELKKPGQTFDGLLAEIIGNEKEEENNSDDKSDTDNDGAGCNIPSPLQQKMI